MTTFRIPKFAQPDILRRIQPSRLGQFLAEHASYFAQRNCSIFGESGDLDYELVAQVLMTPDERVPRQLVNALFYVHGLIADDHADELLHRARAANIPLDDIPERSIADLAIELWLKAPDLVERVHAEAVALRQRSFIYFSGRGRGPGALPSVPPEKKKEIEAALDGWFLAHERGVGTRVFVFDHGQKVWILIRHGLRMRREASRDGAVSSMMYYRPEIHDVLVYDCDANDLAVHCGSKGERNLYVTVLGQYLFGDEAYFPLSTKFTLDPLIAHGAEALGCADIEGIKSVRLVQIHRFWGGAQCLTEIVKANDVFRALGERAPGWLSAAPLTRAIFKVQFEDAQRPRKVAITPKSSAVYERDEDNDLVEGWLQLRGFIKQDKTPSDAPAAKVLEHA